MVLIYMGRSRAAPHTDEFVGRFRSPIIDDAQPSTLGRSD